MPRRIWQNPRRPPPIGPDDDPTTTYCGPDQADLQADPPAKQARYAVRADEYITLDRKQVEFIIFDLVPRPGLTILEGKPKAGKSFLALQLAQAIAQGRPFLGRDTVQGRVLYFMLESELVWLDRLNKLQQHGFQLDTNIFMPHPDTRPLRVNVLEQPSREWIRRVIDEAEPDLVIFDPLRKLHNADEDSSTEMKAVHDHLAVLTKGCATVVVHHTKKFQKDRDGRTVELDPIDAGRGSSGLSGEADTVWLLYKDRDNEPAGRLVIVPRFADRETIPLTQGRGGLWHPTLYKTSLETRSTPPVHPSAPDAEQDTLIPGLHPLPPEVLSALKSNYTKGLRVPSKLPPPADVSTPVASTPIPPAE